MFEHPQASERKGYLAGEDRRRVDAFHELLRDDGVQAIIAARGGYGAHRIIESIDYGLVRLAKKVLIGFSDVCAIHSASMRRAELGGIHGPVVTQLGDLPEEDLRALVRVVAGEVGGMRIEASKPSIVAGRARGVLVGGCLSVIVPMVGSELLYVPDGAILLIEDVGEAPYRIDRMLTHLRLAGVLGRVGGIALGDFFGCDPPREGEQTVEEVLADRLGDVGVPVLQGLPIGHGKRNHAVPLGATVTVDAIERALIIEG